MTANPRQRGSQTLRLLLIVLLALLLAMLVGSYLWLPAFLKTGATKQRFETLGAQAPAATLSATATALAGADFDLLDDPAGERIARDLDLYAWYAAGANAAATDPDAPTVPPESSTPETSAPDTEESNGAQ